MTKGWRVDTYSDELSGDILKQEIIPVDDTIEHIPDDSCGCNPRVEIYKGVLMRIHEAMDGRRELEGKN